MSLTDEITEVFRSSLGVDLPGLDVDLIDTGLLDSLSIVSLVTELERRYSVQIPLENIDFDSIRTARGIQELIESASGGESQPASRSLVLIRAGTGRPVYIPHSSYGSAATAQPLAEVLSTNRTIYSIQAAYYESDDAPRLTLEEMAATYIQELRGAQPVGPYTLVGYSFGGLIAYEMSRQLLDVGETVDLLAMVDTQADTAVLDVSARVQFWAGLPGRWARYILEDPARRISEVWGKLWARVRRRNVPDPYQAAQSDEVRRATAISNAMEATYRPQPYAGDAVLLVAARRRPNKCSPEKIWSTRVRGAFRTEPIPGNHSPLEQDAWEVVGHLLSPLLGERGAVPDSHLVGRRELSPDRAAAMWD